MKALLLIAAFISLIFIKNLAFWSTSQTFIFGDTAIYTLQLATLTKNLSSLFNLKQSILGWNPHFLSVGLPSLSVVDTGYLYPPHWIIAALTKLTGDLIAVFPLYTISLLLHLVVSSFFVYKILKEFWNLSTFPSLVGALIWSFSGFNVEFAAAGPIMISGSYLPLCTYCSLKSVAEKKRRYFFFYFVSLAFSFLVGYPMVSLIVYAFSTTLKVLFRNGLNLPQEGLMKELRYQALGLLMITLPLIAPLYIQSYLNFPYTVRSPLKLEAFLQNPAPLLNVPEPLLPKNTLFNTLSSINYVYLYLSLVGLIIIIQSRIGSDYFKVKKNMAVFNLGLLGLIISLGSVTGLPALIYYALPFLNVFRRLSVFTLIPSFCFSVLVAGRIEAFLQSKSLSKISIFWLKILAVLVIYSQVLNILYADAKDKSPFNFTYLYQSLFLTTLITVVAYFALLYVKENYRIAQAVLVIALLIEAGTNVSSKVYLNSQVDPSRIFKPNTLITTLQKAVKPMERVDVLHTQHSYNTDFLNLEQTQGYLSLASRYGVEINEAFNNPDYKKENLRSIVGVKYIVSKSKIDDQALKEVATIKQNGLDPEFFIFNYTSLAWEKEDLSATYAIYQNDNILPRVYLAKSISTANIQTKEILKFIEKFETPKTVILNLTDTQGKGISESGTVTIEEYSRNFLKAKVENEGDAFLANSTGYYPGWWASVNGKIVKPLQTNWFMMGIFLPPGSNTVEFFYIPYGLIASMVYLLISGIFWLLKGPKILTKII